MLASGKRGAQVLARGRGSGGDQPDVECGSRQTGVKAAGQNHPHLCRCCRGRRALDTTEPGQPPHRSARLGRQRQRPLAVGGRITCRRDAPWAGRYPTPAADRSGSPRPMKDTSTLAAPEAGGSRVVSQPTLLGVDMGTRAGSAWWSPRPCRAEDARATKWSSTASGMVRRALLG